VRRLLPLAQRHWPLLALAALLMAAAGAMQGLMALLIEPIFDRVLNPATPDGPVLLYTIPLLGVPVYLHYFVPGNIHNVWTMVATAILGVFLLRGILDYLGNYFVSRAGLSVVTDLRQRVFDHVLKQDAQFFELNTTGRLMSSIMSDIEKIQTATSHLLADWLRQTFSALALLAVLLQKDWRLALVSLTLLPFVLVPTARLGKRLRRTTRGVQDHQAHLNEVLQESLSGHQVVKAFTAEPIESAKFRLAAEKLKLSNLRYVLQQGIASPLIEFFGAVTIVCLLTYARTQVKAGAMTAGEFTSFVIALLLLYEPVKRLTGIHQIFNQATGASQKVFEYLDRVESIAERPGAQPLQGLTHSIEFRNVSFAYPNAPTAPVLRDLQLTVNAGEVVALVGPSGAGKSTLASLVPRFYDPTEGALLIDGADLRSFTIPSLRATVGIVAQETFLFNDTVLENIRYGSPHATEADVRQAAQAALASEFIDKLPDGYRTIIGERGAKLSGGQRQRLSIARALLKNAPILILDEATSHLDTESELLVQRALANLMAGRTVIVIAHRLSTIRRAHQIIVLDQGRIAETGAHDELIAAGGLYQRLHELQYLATES
jgi:ATP-binding cassette, subfamily B, bacterial MsbA